MSQCFDLRIDSRHRDLGMRQGGAQEMLMQARGLRIDFAAGVDQRPTQFVKDQREKISSSSSAPSWPSARRR